MKTGVLKTGKILHLVLTLTFFACFSLYGQLKTPVLYQPLDKSTGTPTGMQLEVKSESVKFYAFEYSEDASMKNAIRVEVTRGTYYTRYWLNKLKLNTQYYWRAKSISATDSSNWSAVWSFKTGEKLKRYAPSQNPAKTSSSFLYLSCYRAAGFDSFEFQFDTVKSFNSKHLRTVTLPDTFDWFYIETIQDNFLFGKTYFWRVRGFPEATTTWTDTGSFQIMDSITTKYPSTAFLQNVKINFEFTSVYFKQPFQVQIDTIPTFNSPLLIDTIASEGTKQFETDAFEIRNLNYETYYYYRVRAISEADSSKWTYSAFKTKGFGTDILAAENYSDPIVPIKIRNSIDGSTGYQIEVDSSISFNSQEKQTFFSPAGLDTAVNLFFGKTYYTRGRPYHEKDSGEWTRTRPINIIIFPSSYFPFTTSTVHITDSFQFATRTGVDGFQIQATQANHYDTTLFLDTIISEFKPSSTHNIKGHRFKFATRYEWRIRGWHDRDTSIWSNSKPFTTVKSPVQLRPFNSNFLGTPARTEFKWEPLKGGVRYQLWLDTNTNFNSPIFLDTITDSLSLVVSQLLFKPLYYWKIRALTDDDTSQWSEVWTFKVLTARLNLPRNNAKNISLYSLDWNSVEGTTGYILEVDTSANFSNPFRAQELKELSFFHYFETYPKFVDFNTKIYWRVKLFHEKDTTEWSDVWNFTTRPRYAPTLSSPIDSASEVSIFNQLKWLAYSGASSYTVQYSLNPEFTGAVQNIVSGTLLNVTLKPSTRYYWRVRGRNSDGNEFYDFSETWTFTTDEGIPQPKLLTPGNNSSNQELNVTFSWEKFTPSTIYRVEISEDPNFSSFVTKNSTTGNTKFTHLKGQTTYYWRVKTFNGTVESPWSEIWKFTTTFVNSTDFQTANWVRLQPNPTSGLFKIITDHPNTHIHQIKDAQGRIVQQFNLGTPLPEFINLSALPAGLYFIEISCNNFSSTLKLIKE